ncbi:MAG: hypothetical protein K0S76_1320 [Herbinix sp.]|jgi:hypothetical protein|nr:hypothetical protein [Herbinix sp.]
MKKKKSLTGQQIKLIVNLFSLAIFAFSYLYVYSGFVGKTEAAYDEVKATKNFIEEQKLKLSEEDTVRKDTEEVKAEIQEIIDSYPVNIAKEDNFIFIEEMQSALNIKFTDINISDSAEFFKTILPVRNQEGTTLEEESSVDVQNTVNSNASDDLNQTEDASSEEDPTEDSDMKTMLGMETTISMNFTTSYQGFKELMDYITNYPKQTIVDSVAVSYDNATHNLTGSLVLKRFALNGTGKVYENPDIEDIDIGTDNIFGSGTVDTTEPDQSTESGLLNEPEQPEE